MTLHNGVFSLLRPLFSSGRLFFSLAILLFCFSDTNNQYSNCVSNGKEKQSMFLLIVLNVNSVKGDSNVY